MAREAFDVIVIGSGAGGAPVALVLAQAGARVLVLEKGPRYGLRDFTHDEVAVCRRDFFVPFAEDDPHTLRVGVDGNARRTRDGWTSHCVGGATVHMSGFWHRLHPEDTQLASALGPVRGADLADWPIAFDELSPFYDLAEATLGVSGISGLNPFERRARPYPLPPLPPHPIAELVDEAGRARGWHPFPTPRAILSRSYGSRPACNLCGFCAEYGCESGAKSSVLATLLPEAEATGHCEVRSHAMACAILVDDADCARGVRYLDAHGAAYEVEARVVVLAASAVESARLLLLSKTPRFPQGLANRSGLVGKNLTFSTFGKLTAIFDREALLARLGPEEMDLPFVLRSIQDDYWAPEARLGSPKGGTYNVLLHHPNPINAAVRLVQDAGWQLWGEPLRARLADYFHRELWLEVEIFGEYLPSAATFVDLDPDVRDRFGLACARIIASHHPIDVAVSRAMLGRARALLEAMRPAPREIRIAAEAGTSYHLQQGTCRFGDDRRHAVLDRFCQTHDVAGLYVTDGSFLPTSGGVPATPTILANSFRVAAHLRDAMRR